MLKINQLAFKNILKGIHLTIPRSKITLLLGKSGSGKTTLLRCIAQLESEYRGEILCNETPLRDLSSRERSQLIGFIPQSYPLFPHMSILDNCTLSLRIQFGMDRIKANQKALDLLRQFKIDTLAGSLPSEISGGQQQRAAIVRALALDPAFLLFDEPTSALDPENTALFVQLVTTLQEQGRGIAISTQDMQLAAKIFDRTYFLENGHVIEFHDAQGKEASCREGRIDQFLMRTSSTPELALQPQSLKSS